MDQADLRSYFANLIVAKAGAEDERLVAALRSIPRERFVGPGPWKVFTLSGKYVETPSDDLCFLYQDVLVSLADDRRINNGEPSLHARCLAALRPRDGEKAVHIGAGTGYYTAILAQLVGPMGSVVAYEIEPDLATSASNNLADYPQAAVRDVSGSEVDLPSCDIIYINAGATHPLRSWLDALRPGGRLLFPLTPDEGLGGMLLLTYQRNEEFSARFIYPAMFIPCQGARDREMSRRLSKAFAQGQATDVKSLRRGTDPDETCWVAGDGWWLSTTTGFANA